MWTFHPLETLWQDVRYAVRTLRKSPGFTDRRGAGAGDRHRREHRDLQPDRRDARAGAALPGSVAAGAALGQRDAHEVERRGNSYPDFLDWRAQSKSFEDMAAFDSQTLTLAGIDEPERILAEFVSAPYFSLLGVSAGARPHVFRGRRISSPRRPLVVVLSDGLWKRRFGADPDDRRTQRHAERARLHRRRRHAARLQGPHRRAELWVPFAVYAPPQAMAGRGNRGFGALARLKPGVTHRERAGRARRHLAATRTRLPATPTRSAASRSARSTSSCSARCAPRC